MPLLELTLLGDSQTFIGVLATLVVLCVIANSSNFIKEIHSSIQKEVESTLQRISDDIARLDINSTPEHQEMEQWLNDPLNSEKFPEMAAKGNELMFGQSTRVNRSFAERMSGIIAFSNHILSVISSSNIIVLSPLYCFFVSLSVLVGDEIVMTFNGSLRFVAIMCNIMVIISFFMWLFLWYEFHSKVSSLLHRFYNNSLDTNFEFKTGRDRFSFRIAGFIILLVALLFYASLEGAYHTDIQGVSVSSKIFALISTFIAIGIPLFVISNLKSHPSGEKSIKYTYFFPFFHFLFILFLAIVCTLLIIGIGNFRSDVFFVDYVLANRNVLIWDVIVFILTFGLLIPAIVPALAFIKIKDTAEAKKNSICDEAANSIEEFRSHIYSFNEECRKLTKSMSNDQS